jgi:ribonucleoside-diphosphate reductase alpha chain
MLVEKRNGDLVPFDPEKINKVLEWACDGIKNVSVSDVALTSNISIYNKITTSDIHEVMIQSAYNLITEETPNYQWVAGRLRNYALRKLVWGSEDPPKLFDHLVKNKKIYDSIIWDYYTESDIHKIGRLIKHDRDFNFTHAGIQQMVEKYLVQDRTNGKIYETPQFAFILIPMILFKERENRYELIKKAYNAISKFKINLPTPILAGVRTNTKYYSSCVLVNCDDTLDSIFSSAGIIGKYTARRSGIGLNMGKIRAIYSPIRDSEVLSTGIIPFLKVMESSVKSTSQNGLRGGGATVSVPWWHNEIEDVVVLKNNAGTDDNRVKKLDYCVQIDKLFYDRILANEDITLFCPHEAKGLYEAFGTPEFEEKYKKAESKKYKLTKKIKAAELAKLIARERLETGRIYVMHIDHCNTGPWKEKVEMTNLCCVSGNTSVTCRDMSNTIFDITIKETVVKINNGESLQVLCFDERKDKTEFCKISAGCLTKIKTKVMKITNEETGDTLICTPDHKIFTQNRGYVEAQYLKEDDNLLINNE